MTEYNMQELQKYRGRNLVIFASQEVDGAVSLTGENEAEPTAVMPFKEITLYINCTAFGGSLTSLDVNVNVKDPEGEWHVLASFAQLAAVGKERVAVVANIGDELSIDYTLVGAYKATFSVTGTAKIV